MDCVSKLQIQSLNSHEILTDLINMSVREVKKGLNVLLHNAKFSFARNIGIWFSDH